MRKLLLILSVLFLLGSLMAIPTLKVIKTHDYTNVNRVVIVFSDPVKYQIVSNSADNTLQVRIRDAVKGDSYLEPVLENSQIVHSILLESKKPGVEVKIQTGVAYRTEMMTLNEEGYKIVLDIFQMEPPATFEAGVNVANFYFSTHQFNKAKPLYNKLEVSYPDKKEINYYIGKNLIGLKRYEEALARFEKVPQSSREYQFSQLLTNKLRSSKQYSDFQQDFLDSSFDNELSSPPTTGTTTSPQVQTVPQQNVIVNKLAQPIPANRTLLTVLSLAQIPLWVALLLMGLLIFLNAIMLGLAQHQAKEDSVFDTFKETPQEPTIFVDELAKLKMISKLLHDGWSNREISKELHIAESEVESAVKQLSVSDFS
jgi:tetratricopeptide (TPR) repeat protein